MWDRLLHVLGVIEKRSQSLPAVVAPAGSLSQEDLSWIPSFIKPEWIVRVRIVRATSGEAPLNIRSEWIGVELIGILVRDAALRYSGLKGITSGKQLNKMPEAGLLVETERTLEVLRQTRPRAYSWWKRWRENEGRYGYAYLAFSWDEFEIIDRVRIQEAKKLAEGRLMGEDEQ